MIGSTAITPGHENGLSYERPQTSEVLETSEVSFLITQSSALMHFHDQKGIALFLVLWVLTLLSVIVGEFCHAMRTEVNITRNFKEATQAAYLAEAGIHLAIHGLTTTDREGRRGRPEPTGAEDLRWRVNAPIPSVELGAGSATVWIDNESGKINLNSADPPLLQLMLSPFNLDETAVNGIVDAIGDWRDADDLHRLNGAEDDYYQSLPEPYPCKDGPFTSVQELLRVKGITRELFYGGLAEMVTVFPVTARGGGGQRGRININAAPPAVLRALPGMTQDTVAAVAEYRRTQDFRSPADLVMAVPPETADAIRPYLTFQSGPYYTVRSVGAIDGSRTRHAVSATVEMDRRSERGYRIIRWIDNLSPAPGSTS
jgi:general secretion pathway protein K